MVPQLTISQERSQREQARTADELVRLVRVGQEQAALEQLIFFTPPADFVATAHAVEAGLRATFAADDPLNKRRCLTFLAELALALRSFLPRWNLQDDARHGAAILSDEQLRAEADRLQATAMRLGSQVPRVTMELLSAWRREAVERLTAEASADPAGEARALVGNSIGSYLSNVSAEVAHSNLLRIAQMRAAGQTPTEVGNDYAAFLPYALYVGASYVTCNPPLVDRAWASDPERWNPIVDALINAQPQTDPDTLARLATLEVVLAQMRLLRPIFLLTDGRQGFVCLQVNPHAHGDAHAMISDALDLYARARARLNGGTPNVVFKLPGTRAGLEACRALTGQGIGATITVNFGLFQHLPFAEAIQEGRAVSSYLVEMNGRLAFPVRDEMLARLDYLAAHGISEGQAREAAAWAGVAVIKRAHALLKQRGYDLGRVQTLIASLRIYEGDGYADLPSPYPDITETLGAGVISVFPNIRHAFDRRDGLALNPMQIEEPVPAHILDTLAHSEIFKQAYYVGDPQWVADEDPRFRPERVLTLEDEERVAAWPPIYNTLTEFIQSYDTFVERILERKQLLAA